MSAGGISGVPIGAISVHDPSFPVKISKIIGVNPGAVLDNANSQITVMARAGQVGKQVETSMDKLQTLWKAGAAAADMVGAFGQLKGSFNDLVGQGADLGKRIAAIGKILQTTMKIVQFVKAANAAVTALMSNPWSMAAAKALAHSTSTTTTGWLAMLSQIIMTVGTAISAIQQMVQKTESTTAAVGAALDPNLPPPAATTPPFFPTPAPGQPAYTPFPTYGTNPVTPMPTPLPAMPISQPAPLPAPGGQAGNGSGIPNVYNSGWIPRPPGGTGGSGERITISLEDPDGDGKYNVKVDAEGDLDKDLKIGGKIGDQEFNVNIDSDG